MKSTNIMVLGPRAVKETILAGEPISKIFYLATGEDRKLRTELVQLAKEQKIPCQKVPLPYFNRLTSKRHQGIVAVISPIPFVELSHRIQHAYEKGTSPLIVLLDRIQDVRNFGAITRTAVSMGVDALVIPMHGTALIGEDAMKTSAGALNHISLCRVENMQETITYLQESGLQVLACDEKAEKPIFKADLSLPTALLFGNEGEGISPIHRALVNDTFSIPMQGSIASLNVSVATSIVLYETARQRFI